MNTTLAFLELTTIYLSVYNMYFKLVLSTEQKYFNIDSVLPSNTQMQKNLLYSIS